MSDYVLFKNKNNTDDNKISESLGGWGDNAPFKRYETYMTSDSKSKSDINKKLQS